ncbi:transmembrane protein [Anaeramoeba flamelloides]|uniref:Transmembrane protein n=1 Tax=Anaeramoeba flamelloides TaxID=1746091 RepID=A0ABQ8XZQ2_9EUKA|nr:transmembrane protein [Anaeramoeba flamelloides]
MSLPLWFGWMSVVIAIFFWGSFAAPARSAVTGIDVMVYQVLFAFGIMIFSWFPVIWSPFQFTWFGFYGALLWVPCSCLSFFGIKFVGLGIAQSVWSASTIVVSFLAGVLYLKDKIKSTTLSVIALALLVLGLGGFSRIKFVQPKMKTGSTSDDNTNNESQTLLGNKTKNDLSSLGSESSSQSQRSSIDGNEEGNQKKTTFKDKEDSKAKKKRRTILGVGSCILCGLFNGINLVPLNKMPKKYTPMNYISSFGLGVLSVTLFLFLIYVILNYFQKPKNRWLTKQNCNWSLIKKAILPGTASAFLWTTAEIMAVYANTVLTMSVGFGLTNLNCLISNLWAILFFKEIVDKKSITIYSVSVAILLAGAVILGLYGRT